MDSFATPSKRFGKQIPAAENAPMNFYAPPANVQYSNSGVSSTAVNDQGVLDQPQYAAPAPSNTRPGSQTKSDAQVQTEASAKQNSDLFSAASSGFKNSAVPATTDTNANVVGVLESTAAGAASGAAVAGPYGAAIGGGIALVSSGLNAWVGNRQARAERDRANALNADAKRKYQQEQASNEKWKQINQNNTIEEARFERQKYNDTQKRQQLSDVQNRLKDILATNQTLKQQYAQFGFV